MENVTYASFSPLHGTVHLVLTALLLGQIILCTIVGNIFVVAAILLERSLQRVSNYLIFSLAIADLMVATLVMPMSALQEVSDKWWLGVALCDIWVVMDVLCCTASILHLVAIAIDRYWAVTRLDYLRSRTTKPILIMIAVVWIAALAISLPTRFHRSRGEDLFHQVLVKGQCTINSEYGFTIFSTVTAFYLPMGFLLAIYVKIYQAARARIRKRGFRLSQNNARQRRSKFSETPVGLVSKRARLLVWMRTMSNQIIRPTCFRQYSKKTGRTVHASSYNNALSDPSSSSRTYPDRACDRWNECTCHLGLNKDLSMSSTSLPDYNVSVTQDSWSEDALNHRHCPATIYHNNHCTTLLDREVVRVSFEGSVNHLQTFSSPLKHTKGPFDSDELYQYPPTNGHAPNTGSRIHIQPSNLDLISRYQLNPIDCVDRRQSPESEHVPSSVSQIDSRTIPPSSLLSYRGDDGESDKDLESPIHTQSSFHNSTSTSTPATPGWYVPSPLVLEHIYSIGSLSTLNENQRLNQETPVNKHPCSPFFISTSFSSISGQSIIIGTPISSRTKIDDDPMETLTFIENPSANFAGSDQPDLHQSRINLEEICPWELEPSIPTNTVVNKSLIEPEEVNALTKDKTVIRANGSVVKTTALTTLQHPKVVISFPSTKPSLCLDAQIGSTNQIPTKPLSKPWSATINRVLEHTELNRERLENQRERKAARTLAIITGCFILCWLPFFVRALVAPFCMPHCSLPAYVESLLLWLGYLNSSLNPILYTVFSPEFRAAFKKIICGRMRSGWHS